MITAKFWANDIWGDSIKIDCFRDKIILDDNFDETLSTVSFALYGIDLNIEKWDKCRIILDDNSAHDYFIKSVKTEISSFGANLQKYYKIELVECLESAKHIFPDNLCFSNLLADGVPITRTIGEMLMRINNQLYFDKTDVPFEFYFNPASEWANITAPEKFFTGRSLAEILVEIGDVVGGYPELSFNDELKKYLLNYRIWADTNRAMHTDNSVVAVSEYSGIDGHANILSSELKNMQNSLTVTEPTHSEFQPIETDEYITQIPTDGSAVYKTAKPIAEIKELTFGFKDGLGQHSFTVNANTTPPLNLFCVEYDKWRTLPTHEIWGVSITDEAIDQARTLYYKRNTNIIKNVGDKGTVYNLKYTAMNFIWSWFKKTDPTLDDSVDNQLLTNELTIRIKYVPYEALKIKSYKSDNLLPIEETVNQAGNVIENTAMSKYMQGLVERMDGDYSVWQKKTKRDGIRYNSGEWLNGKIIISAHHEYGATEVNSIYTTSIFNRRNEFVEVPHNLRIWEIPEDKIVDRNLHHSEIINVSINTALSGDNGAMTVLGKRVLNNYATTAKPPRLAYMAFKSVNAISGDANTESDNYGMMSLHSIPFGRSLVMYWSASDNASIGTRRYKNATSSVVLQNFIAYNPTTEYVNLKFSNAAPTDYIFDEAKLPFTNDPRTRNATFENTFPASNKKQFTDCVTLFNFGEIEIEKDLRERISMTYQLDFVGKNGTIVYDKAILLNRLCNTTTTNSFKIYKNSATDYGKYETKRHSDSLYIGNAEFTADENGIYITANVGNYTNLAICDSNGNLLFATNSGGNASSVNVYMQNKKREFLKI